MYEFDDEGAILPNPIFHRPWDKMHSRTIEYPFTAAQLGNAQRILDVGSVKGDTTWTSWLESLSIDVHVTDYDADEDGIFKNSTYHQADIRDLPIEDNYFDKILAVSVIEHIGMDDPQVVDPNLPMTGISGDVEAFKEMLRVLKPGGQIIMTVPFGIVDGKIYDSARTYTAETIKCFHNLATPIVQDYYEYQRNASKALFLEFPEPLPPIGIRLRKKLRAKFVSQKRMKKTLPEKMQARHFGLVTWRRLNVDEAQASNQRDHTDGILCGVWQKPTE